LAVSTIIALQIIIYQLEYYCYLSISSLLAHISKQPRSGFCQSVAVPKKLLRSECLVQPINNNNCDANAARRIWAENRKKTTLAHRREWQGFPNLTFNQTHQMLSPFCVDHS